MAEQSDTTNPSTKFDPIGDLIDMVEPVAEKHDYKDSYPGPIYEETAVVMKAAGVDFSLTNAYALTRMIWARYKSMEENDRGYVALFVAAAVLEDALKTELVTSWTDVRVRIMFVKDRMIENGEDQSWIDLVGQIGADVAQMRYRRTNRQSATA